MPDDWQPTQFVRNITYSVREIGLTTIVVLFFLAREAGYLPVPLERVHQDLARGVQDNVNTLKQVKDSTRDAAETLESICYNDAKDEMAKRICRYGIRVVDAEREFNERNNKR